MEGSGGRIISLDGDCFLKVEIGECGDLGTDDRGARLRRSGLVVREGGCELGADV